MCVSVCMCRLSCLSPFWMNPDGKKHDVFVFHLAEPSYVCTKHNSVRSFKGPYSYHRPLERVNSLATRRPLRLRATPRR